MMIHNTYAKWNWCVRIDGSTGVDIQQGSISIKNGGTQSWLYIL